MDQETLATGTSPTLPTVPMPGVEVVARIRRLLVSTAILSFVYAFAMTASRGTCFDSVDSASRCVQLNLRPGPFFYLLLGVVILAALTHVVNRSRDVEGALLTLDRVALAIGILVAAGIVISHIWFWSTPLEMWGRTGLWSFSPFPFGSIEFTVLPSGG